MSELKIECVITLTF